ncbi:hypothetical protein GU336_10065 [Lactococcus raffinolactis]|uniref:Uncharacterized protein n=1 Tax=Pseudolactococcus raffinolactis TaxID=1366 RepID=A0A6H0UE92_9LACT|nr:TPM domain-containing protein [Lactococcus raffinolactis]QIW54451.1 hypothetical protein GU336_10065 [Lactococcus raffinolactis]
MKKFLVLLTLFVASFSVTVAHAEANYVKDDAKVLSQSQVQNLNEMLNELRRVKQNLVNRCIWSMPS